jgi:hypothetical protein
MGRLVSCRQGIPERRTRARLIGTMGIVVVNRIRVFGVIVSWLRWGG